MASEEITYDIRPAMTGATVNKTSSNNQDSAEKNVLHEYASYNYVWTLSALSQEDLKKPQSIAKNKPRDIIAKSSGIGTEGNFSSFNASGSVKGAKTVVDTEDTGTVYTDYKHTDSIIRARASSNEILKRGHDIFFEKVEINGIHRPNEQRKMMNFTKIEMVLHEPYGVTLFEKLKAAAFNNKFMDHIDAPYLLTLEFRGYDNLGNPKTVVTKRVLPIKIVNAEMDINAGGTIYTMSAVPWTEFAMTDRFLYIRGSGSTNWKTPFNTKTGETLVEAMNRLADTLNKMQDVEIERKMRELKDTYAIEIVNVPVKNTGSGNWNLGSLGSKFQISVRPNESIAKVITDCVQQADGFRNIGEIVKKYWQEVGEEQESKYNQTEAQADSPSSGKEPYVPWFKVVTNVETDTARFDSILGMHPKKITYTIIPYAVHVMNFTLPGLSASPLWGKTVKKRYNYIYTGANNDILDLKINYKFGYFQAALVDGTGADATTKKQVKDLSLQELVQTYRSYVKDQPEGTLPLRRYPSYSKSADPSSGAGASKTQVDEFYEYLTSPMGDMVNVQMTILGDPAFIGQDFALPYENKSSNTSSDFSSFSGKAWDKDLGCFNFDQAEPFVTLDFRFPTDIDEKRSVMNFKNLENIVFSGLYKVVSVDSIFDGGKFTQVLDLVRFNNQGKEMTSVASLSEMQKIVEKKKAEATAKATGNSSPNITDTGVFY
ncbi:hypothetical protein EB001_00530 [bacterium]|nr:hypothetical protein [bacterium]